MTDKNGFTLLELIVVVAIIGVMAGFVVINFGGSREEAQNTQRRSDIRQYQTSIEVYANANNGNYPSAVDAMVDVCNTSLGQYASQCPDDPVSTMPSYQYSATSARYVIWAQLAKSDTFYVVCSNGAIGELPDTWTGPAGAGACPL